jgi:type II secretion system protein H
MTLSIGTSGNKVSRSFPPGLGVRQSAAAFSCASPTGIGSGLPRSKTLQRQSKRSVFPRSAFTLIELILVMTLLVIVVSLVVPSLKSFFGGRTLDSEVRRFLSLTHYGQSRAVSEGMPMLLWIDPKARSYGLEMESGYTDDRKQQFALEEGLSINVAQNAAKGAPAGKRMGIRFSPDGNVITATSVSGVSIQEAKNPPVWIRPSASGLNYEVQN